MARGPSSLMKLSVLACVVTSLAHVSCLQAQSHEPFYGITRDKSGIYWFRNPAGERFLSLGVSDIPPGPSRERYDPANPSYAAFRYYGSTADWAGSVRKNLRLWGFNTIGAWGHRQLLADNLPECRVLHWGSSLGFPWCDLFADEFCAAIDEFAQRDIEPHKNDRNLIGWFTDNELQWFADTTFRYHLHLKEPSATRQRLLDLLAEVYEGNFVALQRDFHPGKATSLAELGQCGPVFLKPGGNGVAVVNHFTFLIAEHYYRTVHKAIRRHDSHHLILGDRYMSYCPPSVARAAGPYIDVISTNFDWPDWTTGGLPMHFLRMLHEQSGKPVLISEWYVAAEENRSGNRNRGVFFTKVKTQDQRAVTAERRLSALMGEPYIVGAHWFRYADEPTNGRPADGEDFNFGLVDIHDKPYEQLADAMQRANRQSEALHSASVRRPAAELSVNRYASCIKFPESLEHFTRAAAGNSSPLADLLITWDDGQLYLGFVGFHYVDQELFENGKVPESHRQRVSVTIGESTFDVDFDPDLSSGSEELPRMTIEIQHRHLGVRFTYLIRVSTERTKNNWNFELGDVVPLDVTLYSPGGKATRWRSTLLLKEGASRLADTAPTKSLSR